jgi:IclR family transcriptional regulator, acetate operon repressor
MNTALDRGLRILEHLAAHPDGMPLILIADELNVPRSVCHRLLADLKERGYIRQLREHGEYMLTAKVVSLGLS